MRNNKNNDLGTLIVVLIQVLLIIVIILFIKINNYNKNKDNKESQTQNEIVNDENTEKNDEQEETTQEDETDKDQKEEIEYEAPEYNFSTDEVTIRLKGLDKEYTLAWVSDLHMITDFEKANDVKIEFVKTIKERDEEIFVTEDGVHSKELWPEIVKYLNYNDFDGYLFGGDMMDYCSKSNLDYFLEYYNTLNPEIPKLYIRSDHDYGFWYGGGGMTEKMAQEKHGELFEDKNSIYNMMLEFDEFVIIGINKSYQNISDTYYEILLEKIDEAATNNKQVIIMTHVPYASQVDDSLAELSMQVRNTIYYWGGELYPPDEITNTFLKNVYDDDSPVCQVIAGHLHASWDGMISNQVSEHIFTPAFTGTIGIIHIVPDEETSNND